MCLHNAKRDVFILDPVKSETGESISFWNPLSGEITRASVVLHGAIALRHSVAKGRLKRALVATGAGQR